MTQYRKVPAFLRDEEAAFLWAMEHAADVEFYVERMNKRHPGLGDDFYRARAYAYSDFADDAYRRGTIEVFRAIEVPLDGDGNPLINFGALGKSWSREEGGAGIYSGNPYGDIPLELVTLTGTVKPSDVDWEYGYTSFLYYGEDQWEVSMLPNSPVLVTNLDEEVLPIPIEGNTGQTGEIWELEATA